MDPNVRAAIYEEAPTVAAPDTAMPAEIAKLVERLRMPWPPDGSGDEVTLPVWVFELMNEAAAALTTERAAHAETKRALDGVIRACNHTEAQALGLAVDLKTAEAALTKALKVTEAARAVCDNAKLVDIDKNGAFNYVVPPYLIDALKAAMEANYEDA